MKPSIYLAFRGKVLGSQASETSRGGCTAGTYKSYIQEIRSNDKDIPTNSENKDYCNLVWDKIKVITQVQELS